MWKKIANGKTIRAVIKNMAKNGDHYWIITEFLMIMDDNGKMSYIAKRRPANKKLVKHFEPIYKKMLALEKNAKNNQDGIKNSLNYLQVLLQKNGTSYEEYIDEVINKGFFASLFGNLFNSNR